MTQSVSFTNTHINTRVNSNPEFVNYFNNKTSLREHIDFQDKYPDYIEILNFFLHKVHLPITTLQKAKILVASMYRKDFVLSNQVLNWDMFDLDVVSLVCRILDARRMYNQMSKKTDKIKDEKKLTKHKTFVQNTKSLYEDIEITLNKSRTNFIRKHWIQKLTVEQLNTYLLKCIFVQNEKTKWKNIIDLLHLRPNDFTIDWFTRYIMKGDCPPDTIVADCSKINHKTINDCIVLYHIPIEYITKSHWNLVGINTKRIIVSYEAIDQILFHWSSLAFPSISNVVLERLEQDNNINLPYVELVKQLKTLITYQTDDNLCVSEELISKIIEIANIKLLNYKLDIESPIAILGDASGSMEVAIQTSSIVMSVLCSICDAEMSLFRGENEIISNPPRIVEDVVEFMNQCKAGGSTSPASSMNKYLEEKRIIKTFIIITDEEENTDEKGQWTESSVSPFAMLFKAYYDTIYPAKLIFISFLKNNVQGQMVSYFEKTYPELSKTNKLVQYRMSLTDPDLRKFEYILNSLMVNACTNAMKNLSSPNKCNPFNQITISL